MPLNLSSLDRPVADQTDVLLVEEAGREPFDNQEESTTPQTPLHRPVEESNYPFSDEVAHNNKDLVRKYQGLYKWPS